MDADFIDPVKDEEIFCPFGTVSLGDIVTGGLEWNFSGVGLGSVLTQIERAIRGAHLRKVR